MIYNTLIALGAVFLLIGIVVGIWALARIGVDCCERRNNKRN